MYAGCFLETRFSKALTVLIDEKTEPFKPSTEFFKYSVEHLKPYDKIECSVENLKNPVECSKIWAGCLCNNTIPVIQISQGNFEY